MVGWKQAVPLCLSALCALFFCSSSVNADVCLTAILLSSPSLSSRHIHRSAAHPPGTHPEAVWVSEQGVGACYALCYYATGLLFP